MGVLIFKGMRCGFLKGDLFISLDEDGQFQSKAVLSTSYNILPIWLRIAHDNAALAKTAFETIADLWDENPDNQRKLLLAELTPAVQTFVACGVAFDAFYEQIKPFAEISESDVAAWKRNKTSRAAQISEVIRRVYKLDNKNSAKVKKVIKETIKFRDLAVHPSHELKQAMKRPDIPVGVDWRFCAYRYENASNCYRNTMETFIYLREKASSNETVNESMGTIFEALDEMGLITKKPAQKDYSS